MIPSIRVILNVGGFMMAKVIPKGASEREHFWRRMVKRWEASDLDNMAEFCRREGVPVKAFYNWRQRSMADKKTQPDKDATAFIPITANTDSNSMPPSRGAIRLEIGSNLGITLHDGFDPKLLRSVVAALT